MKATILDLFFSLRTLFVLPFVSLMSAPARIILSRNPATTAPTDDTDFSLHRNVFANRRFVLLQSEALRQIFEENKLESF